MSTGSIFSSDTNISHGTFSSTHRNSDLLLYRPRIYSGLIKLIAGSLSGITGFNILYDNLENDKYGITCTTEFDLSQMPTLTDIARKVAQTEGT